MSGWRAFDSTDYTKSSAVAEGPRDHYNYIG